MEIAAGAGAEDCEDEGEEWTIYTPMTELDAVVTALEGAGITSKSSTLLYIPKTKKLVNGREAELCLNLYEMLDDHDDVQKVHADFDVSDEELERIAGSD